MNPHEPLSIVLGGETWSLIFTTRRNMPRKTWGDCDRRKRVIRVRRDLSPQNTLDTLIHELRHAQHPIMFEAEEFIDHTSTELAVALLSVCNVRFKFKKPC